MSKKIIKALIDPASPAAEAYENIRNGVVEMPIAAEVRRIDGKVGFTVRDYDITDSAIDRIVENARKVAEYGMFGEEHAELGMADLAAIGVSAGSVIYVTAEMGYNALIRHAERVLQTFEYLYVEGCPVPAACDEETNKWMTKDAEDKAVEMAQWQFKVAWDYWVDSVLAEITRNGKKSNQNLWQLRSDLKHRYWSLATGLLSQPIEISVKVERTGNDTFKMDGNEMEGTFLASDVKRQLKRLGIGESTTVTQTVDAGYIARNTGLIHSIGSIAKHIDVATEEGRESFESLIEAAVLRSDYGLNAYLRNSNHKQDDPEKTDGFIYPYAVVDQSTGEKLMGYRIVVETTNPSLVKWITEAQLNARVRFTEIEGSPKMA